MITATKRRLTDTGGSPAWNPRYRAIRTDPAVAGSSIGHLPNQRGNFTFRNEVILVNLLQQGRKRECLASRGRGSRKKSQF